MSVNEARILGRLGQDPHLTQTQNGNAICNFSVATTENYKDKQGNQKQRTEWHRVIAWNRLAENCAQYLAKGRQVYVEGKLETREYEKDGAKRFSTQIVARQVKFIDSRSFEGQGNTKDPFDQRPSQNGNVKASGDGTDMFDKDYEIQSKAEYTSMDIPF